MNPLSEEEYYYKLDNMVHISSEHLRSLFQARWKKESGTDWGQAENQGQAFIQGLGQVAYNKAMNVQKGIIARGCLEEWDISILSTVLLNFGDWRSYKSENVAVRQITNLRNAIAHHPSKKLNVEEYNGHVNSFRLSMQGLGVSDGEIEQAIQKAGRSSAVAALKYTTKLHERARDLIKNNKFENAIECYDEAISMPSLLPITLVYRHRKPIIVLCVPIHLATAYEERAECYIKFAQYKKENNLNSEIESYCNQALKDADQALEVNAKSWKALLTKAQAYRLKRDFEKAVQICRQSLAISPTELQVQNELVSCMSLMRIDSGSVGHVDPEMLPKSFADKVAHFSKGYGQNVTEKEFLEIGAANKTPGHEFYFRGRQYQFGWGVGQNEDEAARCFAKGAELGYAESIHSLAFFYFSGQGVVQNVSKAFDLYQKAAKMSPNSPGGRTFTGKNGGVAAAQYDLGLMYNEGLFVEKDIVQAGKWYKKASENGDGRAAYLLGEFYINGRGVPRNEKLAECQWIQAIRGGHAAAAHALVTYYKNEVEPEKALKMFNIGREMGYHGLAGISEEVFMVEFMEAVKLRDELKSGLVPIEKEFKLDTKGITFMERCRRVKNVMEGKPVSGFCNMPLNPRGDDWQLRFADSEKIAKWKAAAENGSIVAAGLMNALEASTRVMKLVEVNKFFKNEKAVELVNALYDRLNSDYQYNLRGFLDDILTIISKPVEDIFKRQHGKKGDVEMKARLCFVEYNLKVATGSNVARAIELLKEGITMYPDNVNFHIMLSDLYMDVNDFKAALPIVKKGLEKFPNNLELLFSSATLLKEFKSNVKEVERVIAAFKKFVSKAPKDDPKLPSVYYDIASLVICKIYLKSECLPEDELVIKSYYKQGKEAEKRAMSFGISIDTNDLLIQNLESFLGLSAKGEDKLEKPVTIIPLQQQDEKIVERKPYLESPVRKRMLLWQREVLDKMITEGRIFMDSRILGPPKMIQTAPKRLFQLKPIYLSDMSFSTDAIHHDCFIELTIIEEPNIRLPFVQLVAEDKNGDTVLVFIHHVEATKNNFVRLKFGRRIAILNPFMQIRSLETESGIRVDDQDCLIYLGGLVDMCRFCGEENAKRSCGICKSAKYCSKECQEYDWKVFKHKRICSHIKTGYV